MKEYMFDLVLCVRIHKPNLHLFNEKQTKTEQRCERRGGYETG